MIFGSHAFGEYAVREYPFGEYAVRACRWKSGMIPPLCRCD